MVLSFSLYYIITQIMQYRIKSFNDVYDGYDTWTAAKSIGVTIQPDSKFHFLLIIVDDNPSSLSKINHHSFDVCKYEGKVHSHYLHHFLILDSSRFGITNYKEKSQSI